MGRGGCDLDYERDIELKRENQKQSSKTDRGNALLSMAGVGAGVGV